MDFARKIKAARKALRLTQAQAARLLEVADRTYWDWEDGKVPMIVAQEGTLARFAAALEKSAKSAKSDVID